MIYVKFRSPLHIVNDETIFMRIWGTYYILGTKGLKDLQTSTWDDDTLQWGYFISDVAFLWSNIPFLMG